MNEPGALGLGSIGAGPAEATRQINHLAIDDEIENYQFKLDDLQNLIDKITGQENPKTETTETPVTGVKCAPSLEEFLKGGSARMCDLNSRLSSLLDELHQKLF